MILFCKSVEFYHFFFSNLKYSTVFCLTMHICFVLVFLCSWYWFSIVILACPLSQAWLWFFIKRTKCLKMCSKMHKVWKKKFEKWQLIACDNYTQYTARIGPVLLKFTDQKDSNFRNIDRCKSSKKCFI